MRLVLLSFALLTAGMVVSFLMVISLFKPSFLLSSLAYAASVSGLALGVSAVIQHSNWRWRSRD
jgi:hypothetical protein